MSKVLEQLRETLIEGQIARHRAGLNYSPALKKHLDIASEVLQRQGALGRAVEERQEVAVRNKTLRDGFFRDLLHNGADIETAGGVIIDKAAELSPLAKGDDIGTKSGYVGLSPSLN